MNRRRFLTLAPAFLAAPALVRASSIMPVRAVPVATLPTEYRHTAAVWIFANGGWHCIDSSPLPPSPSGWPIPSRA